MAWRGVGEDNIWISTSIDGLDWSPQKPLLDRATRDNPSLAGAGDLAVMAWRGLREDNIWVSTSTDGIIWSPQKPLFDRATRSGPAVAGTLRGPGTQRRFVMAWRGLFEENLWVSTSSDGLNWSPQVELTDRATRSAPGITHSDPMNVFYLAWQGLNENNIWVSSSEDGLVWSPQIELLDRATQSGPIGLAPTNTLYMAWQGLNEANIWVSALLP